MLAEFDELKSLLCCPRCRSSLSWKGRSSVSCSETACALSEPHRFPILGDQPVLVDFEASVLERETLLNGGAALRRTPRRSRVARVVSLIEHAPNRTAAHFAHELICRVGSGARILVVGGGTIGNGAEELYKAGSLSVIGTDIYASCNTQVVADAHQLPFVNGCIDGVWIQAVLEHVLEPHRVAGEIHRVLKPGGVVFADTPFMQQVHEGAYDFTRFTVSGHRWLFRRFDCIDAGATSGPGTALLWSIKYLIRATTGSDRLARVFTWLFLWLRLLDRGTRRHQDAASGVYFFGSSSDEILRPLEIVRFYDRCASAAESKVKFP